MKKLKLIVLLCTTMIAMLFQNNAFGQLKEEKWYAEMEAKGKYGVDSVFCKKELAIFTELVKQQNYKDAYDSWTILFNNYPMCSQNIYSRGVNIVKYQMQQCTSFSEQQLWIDTLMLVYDRRIHFFGTKSKNYPEGYILGRKGVDMLKFRSELLEDCYNTLNKSIELQGEKSEAAVILCAMKATIDMENAHTISRDVVTNNYQKYIKLLNANKTEPSDKVAKVIEGVNDFYNGKATSLSNYTASTNNTTSSSTSTSNNTSSNVTSNNNSASNNNSTSNNTSSYVSINNYAIYNTKIKNYNAIHSQVENEVNQFVQTVADTERRIWSSTDWHGNSTIRITKQDGYNMTNRALSIVKKTVDPDLVKRVKKALHAYYFYIRDGWSYTIFSDNFWKTVYVECAKNSGALNFEIFYFKTFYPIMNSGVDFSILDKIGNQILSTTNRNEQSELYNNYIELCRLTKHNINTSLSANVCNSYVEEINRTRSSTIITECDNISKKWPNYQNDIYNPTEEVRLYNKLNESEIKTKNNLFQLADLYLQKYSNSGYDISETILTKIQALNDEEAINAILYLINSHSDYIKQIVNYDTKLNDLLYQKLSTIDAYKTVSIIDNLTSNNAAYMQNHLAFDNKLLTLYLTKLAEFDETKQNEHILNYISQNKNKKYADKMKLKFNTVTKAYLWIKTKSSASRDWVSTIDQYLTCFPTSTHKTELNTLKSKYVAECNRREAEERRRQEEERRSQEEDRWRQEQQKKEDAKNFEGKYVRAVKYQDIGLFGRYKITIYGKCIYVSKYAVYDSHEYEIEVSSISMTKWNGDKIDDDYDYKELCRIWDKKM